MQRHVRDGAAQHSYFSKSHVILPLPLDKLKAPDPDRLARVIFDAFEVNPKSLPLTALSSYRDFLRGVLKYRNDPWLTQTP